MSTISPVAPKLGCKVPPVIVRWPSPKNLPEPLYVSVRFRNAIEPDSKIVPPLSLYKKAPPVKVPLAMPPIEVLVARVVFKLNGPLPYVTVPVEYSTLIPPTPFIVNGPPIPPTNAVPTLVTLIDIICGGGVGPAKAGKAVNNTPIMQTVKNLFNISYPFLIDTGFLLL